MTELAGPEGAASAAEIGLSHREAAAPPPGAAALNAVPLNTAGPSVPQSRDTASWAAKVDRLEVSQRAGVRGTNVAGRRLTGPVQGFGKMWQKTYRMEVGPGIEPAAAIALWRAHFPDFWPTGNRFAGALTGINPGDVALLDLAVGGGVKLSTGVFVLYADAESFTLMTPQGHMFAGWITFSAERVGGGPVTGSTVAGGPVAGSTVVQAQVLMRASDPLYEIGMTLGGHAKEDKFWIATLRGLGRRLGVPDAPVTASTVCVDSRRQWRHAGSVRHNSMVRSVFQTLLSPLTALGRAVRRSGGTAPGSTADDDTAGRLHSG
jgi:hypothetical protein